MSVYEVLVSGLRHSANGRQLDAKQLREKAGTALEEVGLSAADLDRRPSEFSGGQRQRISIARSLLPQPQLLICDEVVSALDVSIQSQILNLLLDISKKRLDAGQTMSFLFIAHDLKVACYFCDRIGVMYSGELVEEAPAAGLWQDGCHPYTKMLFASATGFTVTAPSPKTAESGITNSASPYCAFAQRCPQAAERCYSEAPPLVHPAAGHSVRCHHVG
jgi:oligopeptide/dipeptide ABC transporter ATP-binding protein